MVEPEKLKEGYKADQDKVRFDLIPADVLWEVAEVMTYGAKKYDDRNYSKGMKWGRLFGGAMRHLWAFWMGEDNDKEWGKSHLAHAICCCMMLREITKTHKEFDDRPTVKRIQNDLL